MPILADQFAPTLASNPQLVATSRQQNRMTQPGFYSPQQQNPYGPNLQQQQQQQIYDPNDPRNTAANSPNSQDFLFAGLSRMQQRPAPPELNPSDRVRFADQSQVAPSNFQGFYDMLGSIKQRGQLATQAAQNAQQYQQAQAMANIAGQYGGNVGSGGGGASPGGSTANLPKRVQDWSSTALQAMHMLNIPDSYLSAIMRRMNQESGGNANAINNWDSNAAAGHPSQGLMQTIPGTFSSYAGNLASRGILDPLANIYAGLNYAGTRYGPSHGGFLGGILYAMNKPGGY